MGWGELGDEYQPPPSIWLDDEALADHFERAKAHMKSGNSGSDWEDIPADSQNELTRGIRKD